MKEIISKNISWYFILKYYFWTEDYKKIINYLNTNTLKNINDEIIPNTNLIQYIDILLIENNNLKISLKWNELNEINLDWATIEIILSDLIDFIIEYITDKFEYSWNITFNEYYQHKLYISKDFNWMFVINEMKFS
jgi:hypothetical protein